MITNDGSRRRHPLATTMMEHGAVEDEAAGKTTIKEKTLQQDCRQFGVIILPR